MPEPFRPLFTLPDGPVAVWSRRLVSMPYLSAFLGREARVSPWAGFGARAKFVAIAGRGRNAEKARQRAARLGLPYLAVEEGFLRSLEYDRRFAPSCSAVVDATGIYGDATRPSDLETLLNSTGWESPELLDEARRALEAVLAARLSKYNHAPDASPYLMTTPGQRTRVLLVDQPVDGEALRLGLADEGAFGRMLEAARRAHPGAALFVKTHPAVLAGRKKGYLTRDMAGPGVTFLDKDVSPFSLLAQADEVYTVTSQMGFEALLLGKKVRCFGVPFYAGWGLTKDAVPCPRRVRRRTALELFAAAYILYSRYVNPVTGEPCSIHEAIRLLAEQRRWNERNSGLTVCLGFSRRQASAVREFLASTRGDARFERGGNREVIVREAGARKGRIVAPAASIDPDLRALCARKGVPLVSVEEGFLRPKSPAGGAMSFLFDTHGSHNDASRPSALETLLAHGQAKPDGMGPLLARARALRERMVREGVLLGGFAPQAVPRAATPGNGPSPAGGIRGAESMAMAIPSKGSVRRVVLVPGEGGDVDRPLLGAARAARPEDFLVYLPLPGSDGVVPPAMPGVTGPDPIADAVILDADILALFPLADEVHVATSLTGFDALLRGLPVFTHGTPFYAGWGLTTDTLTFPRRGRPLTLDGLVAGALILYPAYRDAASGMFCGPEDMLQVRQSGRAAPRHVIWRLRLRRLLARFGL